MDDCLKDMEKSCSLNPNFPSARAQKCYIQYRCGIKFNDDKQKEAALKGYAELEQKFPNCSETLFLYAQVSDIRMQCYMIFIFNSPHVGSIGLQLNFVSLQQIIWMPLSRRKYT